MGSRYVIWWCLTHRYQHLGGTWHFNLQGYKERALVPWRGGQQVPPKFLGLSTRPHGVTSCDIILNKLKSPLHITYLGLIYSSNRVVELHINFLKSHAVSFSLHKTHGDMFLLWTCPTLRIYSCCVFRCHINRRIWV